MRHFTAAFDRHCHGEVLTLCHCFRLRRTDGIHLGFTNHDQPITFDGLTYLPDSGFETTEAYENFDLSPGGAQLKGALSNDVLREEDLLKGVYESAELDIWLVNWVNPDERHKFQSGKLGEIKCQDGVFLATMSGPLQVLDRKKGRVFSQDCDAILGGSRCKVDLNKPDFSATAVVGAQMSRNTFLAEGLGAYDDDWFTGGNLIWQSGQSEGIAIRVGAFSQKNTDLSEINLDDSRPLSWSVGDRFLIQTGCDRCADTCLNKFDNMINFQGFPYMTGEDYMVSYGRRG